MRYLALALIAAAVLAGCGETIPSETPAGRAQAFVLEDLYFGRAYRAYETLHPAFQQRVPRALFLRCAKEFSLGDLDSIKVLDISDDSVTIPGEGDQPAKAVRIRLTSTSGQTDTHVYHQVEVGDEWRWVMNEKALSEYEAGRCPR